MAPRIATHAKAGHLQEGMYLQRLNGLAEQPILKVIQKPWFRDGYLMCTAKAGGIWLVPWEEIVAVVDYGTPPKPEQLGTVRTSLDELAQALI